jgi:hypothetical protein
MPTAATPWRRRSSDGIPAPLHRPPLVGDGWDQLTALWQRIDPAAGWYLVAVGVSPAPTSGMLPAAAADVSAFIERIDALLRAEHHESYCGIVYADDLENPRLIKIYDPNNLGSSCGSSKTPHPPGWIMSRLPPDGNHRHPRRAGKPQALVAGFARR